MATARSNIPHGSILAQLRQRQMDEYQAAEEKKQKNAAFTNQMIQLGGMAAGAALAIPTGGLSLAPMMTGAGLGGAAGGLLGNAVSGTPTSMNQGIGALMSVGNFANQTARTAEMAERTALGAVNNGYQPVGQANPMMDLNLENSMMLGDQEFARPYLEDTIASTQDMLNRSGGLEATATIDIPGGKLKLKSAGTDATTTPSSSSPDVQWGDQGAYPPTPTYVDEATKIRWQLEEEERQRLLERGMGFGTKY